MSGPALAQALVELDAVAHRLRRECPWDREQDERSIVPHTVGEAYELADAAHSGDDAGMLDELGDVLFQVHFLSLLLEERGAGDLETVARHCTEKLVRRHPHVFGDTKAPEATDVVRNWDAIKRSEPGRPPGLFGQVPENLPALLYARKLQRRASERSPAAPATLRELRVRIDQLEQATAPRGDYFDAIGELLFAVVALAGALGVDPELALRARAGRFRADAEPPPGGHTMPQGSG